MNIKDYFDGFINFDDFRIKSRDFRDIIVLALALFFLKFERDTTNRPLLNTAHQMCTKSGDFISKSFRRNDSHLIAETFVGLKIESQTRIVFLNK